MAPYNGWEVTNPQIFQTSKSIPPKPLGVFWDIEKCNVPNEKSVMAVCDLIRKQQFCQGHQEILFAVVCDATKPKSAVLEELEKAQVDIIHIASNKSDATDDKIKQLMRRFFDLHRDGSRIYSPDLQRHGICSGYCQLHAKNVFVSHSSPQL